MVSYRLRKGFKIIKVNFGGLTSTNFWIGVSVELEDEGEDIGWKES